MVKRRLYEIFLRNAKGKATGFMIFRYDGSVDPEVVARMIVRERLYAHFEFATVLIVSGGYERTFDRSQVGPTGSA
jgi:hypothetical protein